MIALGLIGLWVSLWLSYQPLPVPRVPNQLDLSVKPFPVSGTGRFPFRAFLYPAPPLGWDRPPAEQLPLFGANLLFWLAVGAIITLLAPRFLILIRHSCPRRTRGPAVCLPPLLYYDTIRLA